MNLYSKTSLQIGSTSWGITWEQLIRYRSAKCAPSSYIRCHSRFSPFLSETTWRLTFFWAFRSFQNRFRPSELRDIGVCRRVANCCNNSGMYVTHSKEHCSIFLPRNSELHFGDYYYDSFLTPGAQKIQKNAKEKFCPPKSVFFPTVRRGGDHTEDRTCDKRSRRDRVVFKGGNRGYRSPPPHNFPCASRWGTSETEETSRYEEITDFQKFDATRKLEPIWGNGCQIQTQRSRLTPNWLSTTLWHDIDSSLSGCAAREWLGETGSHRVSTYECGYLQHRKDISTGNRWDSEAHWSSLLRRTKLNRWVSCLEAQNQNKSDSSPLSTSNI